MRFYTQRHRHYYGIHLHVGIDLFSQSPLSCWPPNPRIWRDLRPLDWRLVRRSP
jgi:hypothetical protein